MPIGGESGIPDDLLVHVMLVGSVSCEQSTQPVQASVTTANSANPQMTVVIYIAHKRGCVAAVANNEN